MYSYSMISTTTSCQLYIIIIICPGGRMQWTDGSAVSLQKGFRYL